MAAHILCHTNEILPNTFPPPRPSPKDHGMVSEYEPAIIMNQAYSQNHSGITIELDSDITPALHKPMPAYSQQFDLRDFYDPALCVTPEKTPHSVVRPMNWGSDEGTSLKPRNSQKVRFDNFVEVKCLSPDSSPGRDSAITSEPTISDSTKTLPSVSNGQQKQANIRMNKNSDLENQDSLGDSDGPIVVFASDLKESPRRKDANDVPPYILQEKPEHVLARPEFSSTLQVKKVANEVEQAELNVAAAVKEKLKKSRKLKSAIMEKVTSKVNATSPLFDGLVSTEPCEDDLVLATERQIVFKVKPAIRTVKPEDNIVSAPDLLEYLTPDLLQETASLRIDGTASGDDGPKIADLSRAFDVYRHIRTWEGW